MAERALINQLNQTIDEMISGRHAEAGVDAAVAHLTAVADGLLGLPREGFKAQLKADLLSAAHAPTTNDEPEEGRVAMTTTATTALGKPTLSAHLCCKNAAGAIAFYKKVFGARETMRLMEPDGRIGHAEMLIGNTPIMLADEYPEFGILGPESLGGSPVTIHLEVDDVDAVAAKAVAEGAKLLRPVEDQFYGDRSGRLADPFGHVWLISTHIEDVSAEEMQRRLDELLQGEKDKPVDPIPPGFHTVTPYLQVKGASQLIDFLIGAFGADKVFRVPAPDGTIMHAELRIGDSMIEVADAGGEFKAMPGAIHLYVDDADSVYERALEAGATSVAAPVDQSYGDREACVRDPLGNSWYIATHKLTGKPVPEGLRTITPYFHPRGAGRMIDFLTAAFQAEVAGSYQAPDGTIAHAKIRIGDSMIEMGEAHGEWGPMPCAIHLYVRDVDAVYKSALQAGATSFFEPRDEHYGDRVGGVSDPFGNIWYIATRLKVVTS